MSELHYATSVPPCTLHQCRICGWMVRAERLLPKKWLIAKLGVAALGGMYFGGMLSLVGHIYVNQWQWWVVFIPSILLLFLSAL